MFTQTQGQLPVTNNTISLGHAALSPAREQDGAGGRAALPGKDRQPPRRQDRGTSPVELGSWSHTVVGLSCAGDSIRALILGLDPRMRKLAARAWFRKHH